MIIENANILKNEDNTFMMIIFVDKEDEKAEVVLDRVVFEDFIVRQKKVAEVENLWEKKDIKEFHINLEGIALYGEESGNVGKILRHPKTND